MTLGIAFEYLDTGVPIECDCKAEALNRIAEIINNAPGLHHYRFMLERESLNGEDITKEDLDAICPEDEVLILE